MGDRQRRPAGEGGADDLSAGRPQNDSTQASLFTAHVDRGADPNQRARLRFDLEEGRRRRDRATKDVEAAANTAWRIYALRHLEDLAAEGEPFCADDLIERAGLPLGCSANTVGGLFAGASRRGLIKAIGFTQSERPERAAGVQRVWVGADHG